VILQSNHLLDHRVVRLVSLRVDPRVNLLERRLYRLRYRRLLHLRLFKRW